MATYREFREQVRRRRRRKFIVRLSMLIAAAAAICGVAVFAVHTLMTNTGWLPGGQDLADPGSLAASGAQSAQSQPATQEPAAPEAASEAWNTSQPVEATLSGEIMGADYRMLAVPANAAVEYNFFDRAALLGDSVSQGWNLYESPMKAHAFVCAYKSIGPNAVVNKQTADPGDASGRGPENIYDTIINSNPLRLYILLGTNALVRDGEATEQSFLSYYGQMLDLFKADLGEEVDIYVQSITPVRPGVSQPGLYKERIQRMNTQLAVMARQKGCHFVNIYEVLQDENGDLRADLAAADGVHLKSEAYPIMAEYLASHTV